MTPSITAPTSDRTNVRLHGLDTLRAASLLLGIVLHSLLPFIPGTPWLVNDTRSSEALAVPVFVIHLFRMVLFMLLAGYFGRMVLQRRGTGAYLRDRLLRIGLPVVIFWPLAVLPLGLLAVINADVTGVPLPPPPQSEDSLLTFNPGHLWFLVVLLQCVLILLPARAIGLRLLGPERSARLVSAIGGFLSTPAGAAAAAIPYAIALLLQGTVTGGIHAPETLVPSPPALTAYLGAFVIGWCLHARTGSLATLARPWPAYLVLAAPLSVLAWVQSLPGTEGPLAVTALTTAAASWCWVYALLGICVRFLSAERPAIRYLADASYWMYLVHLVLIVGFEMLLVPLDWPIIAKLALTWLVIGPVMLISYHFLVRSTPLGGWLNGRRYRRPRAAPGTR